MEQEKINAFFDGVDFAHYKSIDAINSHGLKDILKMPALFKFNRENPKEPTEAMVRGSRLHTAVLEPEIFKTAYQPLPKMDMRYKESKTILAEIEANLAPGTTLVPAAEFNETSEMVEKLFSNSLARMFLTNGKAEVTGLFVDAATGLQCKMRADYIVTIAGKDFVVDYKTAISVGPEFTAAAYKFGYPLQAAFYLHGYKQITGKDAEFIFVTQEPEGLYTSRIFVADEAFLDKGKTQMREALEIYNHCKMTNTFPEYPQVIENLGLPRWAFYEN